MGFLSWLQGHCPAGASRWGWVAVQLGLFFLASSALLGGMLLVIGLVVATWRKGFAAYWSDGLNRVLLSWCALRFPIPSGNVSRIRHLIVLWPPRA